MSHFFLMRDSRSLREKRRNFNVTHPVRRLFKSKEKAYELATARRDKPQPDVTDGLEIGRNIKETNRNEQVGELEEKAKRKEIKIKK